ncbi:MAG: IS21-like element helper ATPase IstB [Bacteroidales bacterium]|nr:IS21-like element helper ATPase IstB [Bacteroidales bacterium]
MSKNVTDRYNDIMDLCRQLRLYGLKDHVKDAAEGSPSYDEYLYRLLSYELDFAEQRSTEYRIKNAKFPDRLYLEDLERDKLPEDIRNRLPSLMNLDFIRNGQNVILTGNPGTGKTHVATGLGIKACQQGYRVLFTTLSSLVIEMRECYKDRTMKEFGRRFVNYDLVILDELGYSSYGREDADLIFHNLSLRAVGKSTIITSNLSFARWDEVFGDAAITAALVDRLAYRAILVDMTGESYRFHETMAELEQQDQAETSG